MTVSWIDSSDIALYFARTFSDDESSQADIAADAACALVEGYCGRSFGTAPVVDELLEVVNSSIYLGRPILSVQSIKLRTLLVGSPPITLAATSYELLSPRTGHILIASYYGGWALVSYTPLPAVPADVSLAATIIAATMLQPTLDPSSQGIDSYQIGRELMVKFTSTDKIPADAERLLGNYQSRDLVF